MARRFFTSDFHLGSQLLLSLEKWPFKSVEAHDAALLRSCRERAGEDDVIYHLGDLACVGQDRGYSGLELKPNEIVKDIPASFLNIRGNHDLNNKVKSVCDSMHMFLSKKYPSVSLSHYPSYHDRADPSSLTAPVHLCGHVHGAWKHCLDLDHGIMNVNVGCMMWNFKIVSDEELINYLNTLFRAGMKKLLRCKRDEHGKLRFFKPQKDVYVVRESDII